MKTAGWGSTLPESSCFPLIAKDTIDDNPINPVTLFLHLSQSPLSLSESFYRWKASTFSLNGLQSFELNIDFIGSLVTVSVTTRCLLGNCARVAQRRRTRPKERREREQRRGKWFCKGTTRKWEKRDRRGQGKLRSEMREAQGTRRNNEGFGTQQLREEWGRGRKSQRWMRQGSQGIEKGRSFLKCNVPISLLFPSLSNTCHNSSP